MRLVVDTNIFFTFFWKDSVTQKILLQKQLELYSPEYALEEINVHAIEICSKTGLTSTQFRDVKTELVEIVHFIPFQEYVSVLKKVEGLVPDSDDIDFLALAFKLNVSLWSNDVALKKQSVVVVLSTKDLLSIKEIADGV